MKVSNISISISDGELLEILQYYFKSKNINIKSIEMYKNIVIKNIKYKIFNNITLSLKFQKVLDNKIYMEINKLSLRGMTIPKYLIELIIKFVPIKILKQERVGNKIIFIIDVNKYIENLNVKFILNKILISDGHINLNLNNIFINKSKNTLKLKHGGGLFLKLTQTTLILSGDDIMSFIKDFVKMDSFSIFGVDVSQAIYLKGIIINSFEVGDVSVNIKDLRENLLYVQLKIINSVFPGVNIEHIPIKIFVKDLIKSFNNLNMDLDVNSVKFIDDCIEVKINNFKFDMKFAFKFKQYIFKINLVYLKFCEISL